MFLTIHGFSGTAAALRLHASGLRSVCPDDRSSGFCAILKSGHLAPMRLRRLLLSAEEAFCEPKHPKIAGCRQGMFGEPPARSSSLFRAFCRIFSHDRATTACRRQYMK